jgi:hypothetical protein
MDWSVLPGGSPNDTPHILFPLSELDPKQFRCKKLGFVSLPMYEEGLIQV